MITCLLQEELDRSQELQSLRELRDVANLGYLESQLTLCRSYVLGHHGGIRVSQAIAYVKDFLQKSQPTHVDQIYEYQQLTHSMR